MQELAIDNGSDRACPANNVLHRIAARVRFRPKPHSHVWAANGEH